MDVAVTILIPQLGILFCIVSRVLECGGLNIPFLGRSPSLWQYALSLTSAGSWWAALEYVSSQSNSRTFVSLWGDLHGSRYHAQERQMICDDVRLGYDVLLKM